MAPPGPGEALEAARRWRGRLAEGEGASELSDAALGGFLWQARGDEGRAGELLRRHLRWRRESLPVARGEVAEVLQAGGLAVLEGTSAAGHPVLLLNFRRLMEADFSQEGELARHIRAAVYCAEEMLSRMPPNVSQWVSIINCTGIMMPPSAFLQGFQQTFKANYPERCHRIILYPIPRLIARVIQGAMQWVPANTRDKMSFVASLDDVCRAAGLAREQLPEHLLDPRPLPAPPGALAAPEAPPSEEAAVEARQEEAAASPREAPEHEGAGARRAEGGDARRWPHWGSWALLCTSRSAAAVLA
ncbi:unnamed protein product [Prorocentrum cordatum]|uniref:CRAL-TRIO domain-containing protein n=1 Tax=Prorocentrum cordatum TaxID=2364126 RepID=A0ABN9YGV7_9DINO|nr:unnamed protein product [Polarella glacialis]